MSERHLEQVMWTEKLVEQFKEDIKAELDHVENQEGQEGRDRVIQARIAQLEQGTDSESLLQLYIYLVSSLVLHVRTKNLTPQRVKKTITLANSILLAQGIKENTSRLSFLHGELHSIWSQIEWQGGHHWQAAWHQFLGYQVTRGANHREQGFQQLTMANRALRLGHVDSALEGYYKAQDLLSGDWLDKCQVNIIRSLRLADRRDESRSIIESTLAKTEISPSLHSEIIWEKLVHDLLDNGDLNPMLKSVKKKQPHHSTSHIIEVCLWAMIHPSKNWLQRIPSLENLKRKPDLKPARGDIFYEAAKTIFECYDSDIPLNRRLTSLGEKLALQNTQLNVDKELLVWAASTRWLIRSRNQILTKITLKEYQSLCQKLSSGKSIDLLGLGNLDS
ncbi:hypothetical protein [Pseudobacteriovorax antillogorgiicola]|uniref:hypothetical protein n=1 Tax=Pseudobacteriovorax antillogorgiicola TaxID=1513793 RepID=UPI001F30FB76|nr:hypothetical protein [Pseudobacteriovorax antillogorgiicola]